MESVFFAVSLGNSNSRGLEGKTAGWASQQDRLGPGSAHPGLAPPLPAHPWPGEDDPCSWVRAEGPGSASAHLA